MPPAGFLKVRVDGREASYFEWMAAGLYSPDPRESAMHGRVRLLREVHYGFGDDHFFVRVDVFGPVLAGLKDGEFRLTIRAEEELRVVIRLAEGKIADYLVETKDYLPVDAAGNGVGGMRPHPGSFPSRANAVPSGVRAAPSSW